ncbi:MAG TPA: glycosyltransferase family 4 protein, partial [Steroidobacteraceae bacterium]|nr:glycosyltransferase family 4 protein [Steroidobacteraceae bacterium]
MVFVNRYFAPDQSATSRMLTDLAFRLADRGVSVAVVTSRQLYEDPRAALPARETINGVEVYRVSTATRGRSRLAGRALDYASFHAAAGIQLVRILRRGDVVVAKTDPPLISLVVARAAALRGAVLVNWLQDLFPEVATVLTPGVIPSWLQRRLVAARNRSLRRAAMNVVLGEAMRSRLLEAGVAASRVQIVPNWADPKNVVPLPAESSATRARLGLQGRFVIGYSGNLGRAHEFDTLIGAARLLRSDPHFAFLITGAGAKADALRDSVRAEGLDSFFFQGYQPAELLGDSLAAADVHFASLLPALEGLIVPSKIYGILAAGRPAVFIGAPDGDLGRLVTSEGCGIAVAVGDSARLAAELVALRDSPERLQSMGMRARALAVSRYTTEHAVADWLGFLASIAPSAIL